MLLEDDLETTLKATYPRLRQLKGRLLLEHTATTHRILPDPTSGNPVNESYLMEQLLHVLEPDVRRDFTIALSKLCLSNIDPHTMAELLGQF